MGPHRVGIRDVAREAGVSVTTVSHVLNNVKYARASEETRARVRAAAQSLGYRPNRIARSLRLQRSEMIGFLSEDIATTPHAGRIILGAQEAAREAGLTLVLVNTSRSSNDVSQEAQVLLRQQVDGVLYATMFHRVLTTPDRLAEVPSVLIDAEDSTGRIPGVVPDEAGGASTAVGELVSYGHRKIGFLTNDEDVPATRGRLLGYRESLERAGIAFDPSLVIARTSETAGGHEAALELLSRPDRPTALFCYNDRMAMGAYRAAAELGLRIPEDLSVVGFDNQEIVADGLFPGLTTVELPHYEMGQWAMRHLITLIGQRGAATAKQAPPVSEATLQDVAGPAPTDAAEYPGPARPPSTHVLSCPLVRRDSVSHRP